MSVPSHKYLNATAAAVAESSDVLMPLVRISTTVARTESSAGAVLIHLENAPIVEQTEG